LVKTQTKLASMRDKKAAAEQEVQRLQLEVHLHYSLPDAAAPPCAHAFVSMFAQFTRRPVGCCSGTLYAVPSGVRASWHGAYSGELLLHTLNAPVLSLACNSVGVESDNVFRRRRLCCACKACPGRAP
jgi:hypothetical protein